MLNQVQRPHKQRQQGCLSLVVGGTAFIWFLLLCVDTSAHDFTGFLIVTYIAAGICTVCFCFINNIKRERKQKWQAEAYQYWQWQQEQVRLAYERAEWERQERIRQAQTLNGILALSPRQFEELIGQLLTSWGYTNVEVTGKSGDVGADLVAIDKFGEKVIVQCKRYSPGKQVGSPDIQLFFGAIVHHWARRGIYVTSSTFSKPAITLASEHGIQLIDGSELIRYFQ